MIRNYSYCFVAEIRPKPVKTWDLIDLGPLNLEPHLAVATFIRSPRVQVQLALIVVPHVVGEGQADLELVVPWTVDRIIEDQVPGCICVSVWGCMCMRVGVYVHAFVHICVHMCMSSENKVDK